MRRKHDLTFPFRKHDGNMVDLDFHVSATRKCYGNIEFHVFVMFKNYRNIRFRPVIYDVFGWSTPITITAKLIFSEVCLLKLHWDQKVPNNIQREWEMWQATLQKVPSITVPWCIFKLRLELVAVYTLVKLQNSVSNALVSFLS